ncbi:MAG: hypothetical protein K0S39_2165 [Paenibacillus sp.]|nr:hypothetical protein [Paenibacillus sp.]
MSYDQYMIFLLEHHAELNLPYDFRTKFSFISSPLVLGKLFLGVEEEEHVPVAAIGFVYGTGAMDYEDKHICQIEVAFIRHPYRRTRLFLRGLQFLTDFIARDNPDVQYIQFWTPAGQKDLKSLFSKLGGSPKTGTTGQGEADFYQIDFKEWVKYCSRFKTVS